MQLSDEALKNLWQTETARGVSRRDCLSSETLLRAGAHELRAPEAERVAAHLAACADCAGEYQIALAVHDWAEETVAQHPTPALQPSAPAPWWSRLVALFNPLTATLTAALLLVSLALGAAWLSFRRQNQTLTAQVQQQREELTAAATLKAQLSELQRQQAERPAITEPADGQATLQAELARLKQELAQGAQPQLDVPQFDLDPAPATRGDNGSNANSATLNVPAAATVFTLNLPGAGSQPFPQYLIELQDAKTSQTVWSARRNRDGETTFTLTLAKRGLTAGRYRIRVYGVQGRQKTQVQDYAVQLKYAASR